MQNLRLYTPINITKDLLHQMKQTIDQQIKVLKKRIRIIIKKILKIKRLVQRGKAMVDDLKNLDNALMEMVLKRLA